MSGVRSHVHGPTHASIWACYRRTCKTLYEKLITRKHFGKCAQLSVCKLICNLMLRKVPISRNLLYYIVFGS